MPVIVKLAQYHQHSHPGPRSKAGGADAVSLINTVSSIISVDLDRMAPTPTVDGKGTTAAIVDRPSRRSRCIWSPR
jgi:dihydropyrimidine dehydrogenase (NAD+) subunit PreA